MDELINVVCTVERNTDISRKRGDRGDVGHIKDLLLEYPGVDIWNVDLRKPYDCVQVSKFEGRRFDFC